MSARAPTSVASPPPDPDRRPTPLPRVGRLLGIVHRLVAYGTALIATLEQGASEHRRFMTFLSFGTQNLALIIARIRCGLRRAAALEARLQRYVARGRDLTVPPLGLPGSRAGQAGARAKAPAGPRALVLVPSVEAIAAQVRRRPLGSVIADICWDLGLARGPMDGGLMDELMRAVVECGIDLGGFFARGGVRPVFGYLEDCLEIPPPGWHARHVVVMGAWQPP